MKSILLTVITVMPFFAFSQYTYEMLQVNFLTTDAETGKFTFQNLRLYPISQKEAFRKKFSDLGNYLPLKKAIEQRKVKITEAPNGGSVNELVIQNLSADTVIILPGEIIKGGKQDRIIQEDVLLKPKSGKVRLPVYCVESGRWSGAQDGEFHTQYALGAMSLRKVVEKDKDQSKVWSKVSDVNSINKTETRTDTYTAISNSPEFTRKLHDYLQFFQPKLSHNKDIIGLLVVSGDKVIGCDMFATPALFQEHLDNLLHAYATEAILSGKPVHIAYAKVKVYADSLLGSEKAQEETIREKGSQFKYSDKKIRVTSFE